MKKLNPTLKLRRIVTFLLLILATLTLISCLNKDTTESNIPELADQGPYIGRSGWSFASSPLADGIQKGLINYFNPSDFYFRDVYEDSLMDESQYDEKIYTLRCKLSENEQSDSTGRGNYWVGVTRYFEDSIDYDGIDYLEIKILDNDDAFPDVPVTMHIDMGKISEDFYEEEFGVLSSEDQNGDGLLDYGEDRGFDGIENGDLEDSEWDDYSSDMIYVQGYQEYPNINQSEGNWILDTEDLSNNGLLDTANAYYEYTINLDGQEYLHEVNSKGLKTYRIPKDLFELNHDESNYPNFSNLNYLRFWFEYAEPTYVILVSAKLESYEERGESVDLLK